MIFFYHGNSMKGTSRITDFLILEPCDLKNLGKGDVIAFLKEKEKDKKKRKIGDGS